VPRRKDGPAPQLFVASSTENLAVARALCRLLRRARRLRVDAREWKKGTFRLGDTNIESLERKLDEAQFAVMVLTPDDVAYIRKKRQAIPRDNVLFELGLFMGRLGRERCYMLYESDRQPKRPTDLLGVTAVTYPKSSSRGLEKALAPACAAILERVGEVLGTEEREGFAERVAGTWWEEITTRKGKEVSFFSILPGKRPGTVSMEGDHYDGEGQRIGHWESTAVELDEQGRQIVYGWEGSHPARADQDAHTVRGFGTLSFYHAEGDFQEGEGEFLDIVRNRLRTAKKKSVHLRRESRKEVINAMRSSSDRRRGDKVKKIRKEWERE
jgi:hypothetical protein